MVTDAGAMNEALLDGAVIEVEGGMFVVQEANGAGAGQQDKLGLEAIYCFSHVIAGRSPFGLAL
jgi:hypothetical protein